MKYITNTLKSKYCMVVLVLSLITGYFLVPKRIFYSWYIIPSILFIMLFSLTITCIVRNVKERILVAKTYKSSILSIIAIAIGVGALEVCGIRAPVCGAAVGIGVLSAIFPATFTNIFSKYSLLLLTVSILFQLIALYFMNCFKSMSMKN